MSKRITSPFGSAVADALSLPGLATGFGRLVNGIGAGIGGVATGLVTGDWDNRAMKYSGESFSGKHDWVDNDKLEEDKRASDEETAKKIEEIKARGAEIRSDEAKKTAEAKELEKAAKKAKTKESITNSSAQSSGSESVASGSGNRQTITKKSSDGQESLPPKYAGATDQGTNQWRDYKGRPVGNINGRSADMTQTENRMAAGNQNRWSNAAAFRQHLDEREAEDLARFKSRMARIGAVQAAQNEQYNQNAIKNKTFASQNQWEALGRLGEGEKIDKTTDDYKSRETKLTEALKGLQEAQAKGGAIPKGMKEALSLIQSSKDGGGLTNNQFDAAMKKIEGYTGKFTKAQELATKRADQLNENSAIRFLKEQGIEGIRGKSAVDLAGSMRNNIRMDIATKLQSGKLTDEERVQALSDLAKHGVDLVAKGQEIANGKDGTKSYMAERAKMMGPDGKGTVDNNRIYENLALAELVKSNGDVGQGVVIDGSNKHMGQGGMLNQNGAFTSAQRDRDVAKAADEGVALINQYEKEDRAKELSNPDNPESPLNPKNNSFYNEVRNSNVAAEAVEDATTAANGGFSSGKGAPASVAGNPEPSAQATPPPPTVADTQAALKKKPEVQQAYKAGVPFVRRVRR